MKRRHYYLRVEKRKNDVNGNPRDRMWVCAMNRNREIVPLHEKPLDIGYMGAEQRAEEWLERNVGALRRFPKSFVPEACATLSADRTRLSYPSGANFCYARWLARHQVKGIVLHRI